MEVNNKKNLIFMVIGAITLIAITLGATYAYFTAQGNGGANINVNAGTATTDNLSFQVGESINLTANQEDFGSGMGNKSGETYARAILTANNATNTATRNYYVYLNITNNDFEYTTGDEQAEILLKVTDPDGSEVTSINGLTRKTSGTGDNEVSGFDITTKTGYIPIVENYEITSTGTATQEWQIEVIFVNLDSDQNANTNKTFNGLVIIREEEISLAEICGDSTLAECLVNTIYTTDGENGLYLHDGEGTYTNANLEDGDNSLRFTGSDYELSDFALTNGYTKITANNSNTDGALINFYCDGVKQYLGYDCVSPQSYYFTLNYSETNQYDSYNSALNQAIEDGYVNADNIKNYVCFGSDVTPCPEENLYRIIGVFNGQIKLIKADYTPSSVLGTDGEYSNEAYTNSEYATYRGSLTTIDRYYRNYATGTNLWEDSSLNSVNLNVNYLNSLETNWQNLIADTTWYTGGMYWVNAAQANAQTAYNYEVGDNKDATKYENSKIGLMYVSDYYYAASPEYWSIQGCANANSLNPDGLYGPEYDYRSSTNDNWMYLGLWEWTISHTLNYDNRAYYVNGSGYVGDATVNARFYGIRPVFNLLSTVKTISGSGTKDNPIILSVS